MFWDNFARYGNRKALCCNSAHGVRSVTYGKLEYLCHQFGEKLSKRSFKKELILIDADNSVESIIGLYGALKKGHAVVLCEQGNDLLKQNLVNALWPDLLYEKGEKGWQATPTAFGSDTAIHDDLALLLTTSGSTGEAKCVRLSKKNIEANTRAIVSYLPISDAERCLMTLPIFYSYGLSVLNTHLSEGATVFLQGPSVEEASFASFLHENKITSFAGVPHTFELLRRTGFCKKSLPHLKYLTQAGGRLRPDLVRTFDSWSRNSGKKFFVMYGQTEASPRIAYVPPELLAENPDCIGRAIPGGELQIIGTDNRVITEKNTEGELVYRGPNVMMGYSENRKDLAKGHGVELLPTGDLGILTDAGLYKLTGREKRIGKIYGKRYNLDDIEAHIKAIDATAVCLSDDVSLFIAAQGEHATTLAKEVSGRYSLPRNHIVVRHYEKIPLLASGKADYGKLAEDFSSSDDRNNREGASNSRKTAEKSHAQKNLLDKYQEAFPGARVRDGDSFLTLGGDSLTYVDVSIDIERILGCLPDGWEKMTVTELAGHATASEDAKRSAMASLQAAETGAVLRAFAICAIVTNHISHIHHMALAFDGGALILMLVAGFNFSRFHLDNFLVGKWKPAFVGICRDILLPYWAVLGVYNLAIFWRFGEFPVFWAKFFLIGNYYHQLDWLPFPTWFVQVLVQAIAVLTLPLLVPCFRRQARKYLPVFFGALLLGSIFYRLIDQRYLMVRFPTWFADQRTAWEAWIFILGLVLYRLKSGRDKTIASIALVLLALLFWHGDWSRIGMLSLAGLLLIWKSHLSIPKLAAGPVKELGASSMYIYMTHLTGIQNLIPYGAAAHVLAGLLHGIFFRHLWLKSRRILMSLWPAPKTKRLHKRREASHRCIDGG